jgi:hypothetical protein
LPSESNEGRGATRSVDFGPIRSSTMLDTLRLYLEATMAVAVMVLLGIIFGLATIALTGDAQLASLVAGVAFVLAGVVLGARLWRMNRTPIPPAAPPA